MVPLPMVGVVEGTTNGDGNNNNNKTLRVLSVVG
jgi:hypothetical protein